MGISTRTPKISVLMPVYNAEPFLEQSIKSILDQSFSDFQLLICDDGSTDNSYDTLLQFNDDRITLYRNKINYGIIHTTNKLFNHSEGELITFQDADDWSENNRLELQENAFRNDLHVMLCGVQCTYVNGKRHRRSSFPLHHAALLKSLASNETSICCGASVMFRTVLLAKYGGYRSFFDGIGAEHLDFFWRMIDQEKFINLPQPLYYYRATPNSFTRRIHNNPLKFYSTKLALLAYWQRKRTNSDFLAAPETTHTIVEDLYLHHKQNPSLTPSITASAQLAFGYTGNFLILLKQTVASHGLTVANLKTLITAVPLFCLCNFAPKVLTRYLVRRSNRRFLEKHGITLP